MNGPVKKLCRNCKHFDIESAKDAAGRIRGDRAVKCLWPVPAFPICVMVSVPKRAGYTVAGRGSDCPCFEERK